MLEVRDLCAAYGRSQVLFNVGVTVPRRQNHTAEDHHR
jgi:ABC-type branched-subunit amino acid transport system ATPase component